MHLQTEQLACALLLCYTDLCARFFLNDLPGCVAPPPPPPPPRPYIHLLWQWWLVEVHITFIMGLWDPPGCDLLSLLAVILL